MLNVQWWLPGIIYPINIHWTAAFHNRKTVNYIIGCRASFTIINVFPNCTWLRWCASSYKYLLICRWDIASQRHYDVTIVLIVVWICLYRIVIIFSMLVFLKMVPGAPKALEIKWQKIKPCFLFATGILKVLEISRS